MEGLFTTMAMKVNMLRKIKQHRSVVWPWIVTHYCHLNAKICHFLWPNWKHFWREYIFLGLFCQFHCYFSALRSKNEKNLNLFVGLFNCFVLSQLLLWEVNWFRIKTSKQKEQERVCERELKQQLVTQRNSRNMCTLFKEAHNCSHYKMIHGIAVGVELTSPFEKLGCHFNP